MESKRPAKRQKGQAGAAVAAQKPQEQPEEQPPAGLDGSSSFDEISSEQPELESGDGELRTEEEETEEDVGEGSKGKQKKVLSSEKIRKIKEDYDRRGVVYVSRCGGCRGSSLRGLHAGCTGQRPTALMHTTPMLWPWEYAIHRIPPHMKPMKLKQLLSQYGEVLRVYCAPEDPRARKLRKKKGGNTGREENTGSWEGLKPGTLVTCLRTCVF